MRATEINYKKGCALCDATWGEHWEVVEGEKRVFCCDICATAFKNMLGAVKKQNGWKEIDRINITGNNNVGRKVTASQGGSDFRFYIKFHGDGEIMDFHEL